MRSISVAKYILSGVALLAAVSLSFLSFFAINDITANMLVLVAQFLLYSLTLAGFGELVRYIVKTFHNENNTTLHA